MPRSKGSKGCTLLACCWLGTQGQKAAEPNIWNRARSLACVHRRSCSAETDPLAGATTHCCYCQHSITRWEMSILTICGIEMAGAQGRSFCKGCDSNCKGSARFASGFRKHVKRCPPAQALLAAARGQLSQPTAPAEPAGAGHAAAVGAAAGPPAAVTAAAAAAGVDSRQRLMSRNDALTAAQIIPGP